MITPDDRCTKYVWTEMEPLAHYLLKIPMSLNFSHGCHFTTDSYSKNVSRTPTDIWGILKATKRLAGHKIHNAKIQIQVFQFCHVGHCQVTSPIVICQPKPDILQGLLNHKRTFPVLHSSHAQS